MSASLVIGECTLKIIAHDKVPTFDLQQSFISSHTHYRLQLASFIHHKRAQNMPVFLSADN